jgi:fructoselysine-6-P-deglycase FrlB-like protein
MAGEVAEQPSRLAALPGRAQQIIGQVRRVLPQPPAGTVLAARGSSDHAATTGRTIS